jgi:hypothetical protein
MESNFPKTERRQENRQQAPSTWIFPVRDRG